MEYFCSFVEVLEQGCKSEACSWWVYKPRCVWPSEQTLSLEGKKKHLWEQNNLLGAIISSNKQGCNRCRSPKSSIQSVCFQFWFLHDFLFSFCRFPSQYSVIALPAPAPFFTTQADFINLWLNFKKRVPNLVRFSLQKAPTSSDCDDFPSAMRLLWISNVADLLF